MWEGRGLWHTDTLDGGGWSPSVHLGLVVGVRVQGACTGPGEYAESGHDSGQVI